jgi:hypothetical protein
MGSSLRPTAWVWISLCAARNLAITSHICDAGDGLGARPAFLMQYVIKNKTGEMNFDSHLGHPAGSNPEMPVGQISQLPVSPAGYPNNSAALDPAECILLIAIRWWVDSYRRDEDPMPRLCQGLEAAGTCDAAFSVDALMAIIARTVRQPIAIHCPRCPNVSDDERLLLPADQLERSQFGINKGRP